jgi:hypothetical protein
LKPQRSFPLRALRKAASWRPSRSAATVAHPGEDLDAALATVAAASIDEVQGRGYHLQRRDYYSALNDLPFLRENWDLWHERPMPAGIGWDLEAQLGRVRAIRRFFPELADVPLNAPEGPPAYHWQNDFWRGADAIVQYGLLRERQPRRIVEIGAGWSSLLMARALERNRGEGAPAPIVDQVEPFPRRDLLSALPAGWRRHEVILQRADLALFDALGAGDVCFYDGSHVARAGSDVVFFFFEVLPRLRPGVLVHVHDVFWPDDYPDEWVFERGQTWNEQYVLQAFLMYNEAFVPLICNSWLSRQGSFAEHFGDLAETQHSGVSLWLERTGANPG